MEKLIKISQVYEVLLEQRKDQLIVDQDYNERKALLENHFIEKALQYGQEKGFDLRHLSKTIALEIIKERPATIDPFLLVKLMWESEQQHDAYCLETLERMLRYLLTPETIDYYREYLLECFLDIWNEDSDQSIPIDILEAVITKEHSGAYGYGAMIKAVSYLMHSHEDHLVEVVLEKARKTSMYLEDEYYVDWIEDSF